MKPALSFAQILEEKLAGLPAEEHAPVRPSSPPTAVESTLPLYIRETVSPFDWNQFVKAKLQSAYPQTKNTRRQAAVPSSAHEPEPSHISEPQLSEPQWPSARFSAAACIALERLGIRSPLVSASTVKKAYRRLARRLHPDTGRAADAEAFLVAQDAYEILTRELEQLARTGDREAA